MSRSVIAAAVLGLVVLTGCGNGTEPSAPPTSEDALTTVTSEPDMVVETTEAAPTTESPEETEADGPPEMPEAAKEQTEEGAEAFALHYIDLINYTGMHPQVGLLEPLGADGCASCDNHEESVAYGVAEGDYLEADTFEADEPEVILTDGAARVAVPVTQAAQTYMNGGEGIDRKLEAAAATLVFRLNWVDGWTVSEVTVAE